MVGRVFCFLTTQNLMCLISLAFVFFKAFIFAALHTQREILFSLNSLFFHFHTVFYVCFTSAGDSGSKQSLISLRATTIRLFRQLSRSSKLANTVVFHHFADNSGRGTLGFRFSPGCRLGLLLCIRVLAQLNFHAFLAVFSSEHSHTPKSFSLLNALLRIRPN